MASILRALRPVRNELKKATTEPPIVLEEFSTPKEREKYIKEMKLFIATLSETRGSFKELLDKILTFETTDEKEKKAIDELVEADSLLLLDAGKCLATYINHVQSLTETLSTQPAPVLQSLTTSVPQQPQPAQTQQPPAHSASAQSVKLPKLDMRKFSGDIIHWQEFWDSYEAAVHSNSTITPVAKFTYLRTVLVSDALNAISGLALTTDNYNQAITILKQRYGNPQLVINSHYYALSNLQQALEGTGSIRNVVDTMEKHLRSLEALREDVNHNHFISVIFSKLPKQFIMRLEEGRGESPWTVQTLRAKIQHLLTAREVAEQHQKPVTTPYKSDLQKKSTNFHTTTASLMTGTQEKKLGGKCVFCTGKHWSDECRTFSSIETRKGQIKGKCFICLQKGHTHKDCKSERPCAHCGQSKNHHRSLCPKTFPPGGGGNSGNHRPKQNSYSRWKQQNSENACTVGESSLTETIIDPNKAESTLINTDDRGVLQTACTWIAPINAKGNAGSSARIVLDCGSQRTYVTDDLVKKLNIKSEKKEILMVYPFGVTEPKRIETNVVKLEMRLLDGSKFQINAHTVPKIGEVHHPPVEVNRYGPLFQTLPLADSTQKNDTKNRTIELLIGNNYYWDLVTSEKIELTRSLYLIGTKLGWTVSGRLSATSNWNSKPSAVMMTQVTSIPLEHTYVEADPPILNDANLQDWWKLETIGIHDSPYEPSDELALTQFNKTIQYDGQRYFVTWPWKDNVESLPTNYTLALGRLNTLIRRLKVDPILLEKYDEIIRTQEARGIIEPVSTNETLITRKHYLPHHPIITPDCTTTKVRIVYDGSAKTNKENPSLNECLHRGPVILDDVGALLIRFRFHKSALIADIEKAFLQIGLQTSERDVTRFLWMKDPQKLTLENNLQIYRFSRVPFGIISSPFLLGATIRHHLSKDGSSTAQRIKKDIYVDNVISGAHSTKEAIKFYEKAKSLFQSSSMNLREWSSNDPVFMSSIPETDRMMKTTPKVLGLLWNTEKDTLSLINPPQSSDSIPVTKRQVLKMIAKVFDPLGLWSPTMVKAKSFLQILWSEDKDWDTPICEDKLTTWKEISTDLFTITSLTIPRYIGISTLNMHNIYEIHCFTDASKNAYGACVYLRVKHGSQTSVTLLFAKTRVTPIRNITLPRLELLAATIGGRIIKFVENSIDVPITSRYFWIDSQCVLHWIRSTKSLSVFVSNRVKELRKLEKVEFRYVPTDQNPADLASRGVSVGELQKSNLWWKGPSWLTEDYSQWPNVSDHFCIDADTLKIIASEEKKSIIFDASLLAVAPDSIEESPCGIKSTQFSRLTRLVRVTAWCIKFCTKLKAKLRREDATSKPTLDTAELKFAKELWLKHVQRKHFAVVFDAINKKQKQVPIQQQLNLWVDEHGLLRCKGRLTNANLTNNAIFPILLPKGDWFTTLVIQNYHEKLFHSGVAHTLAQIRSEFWIPSGRAAVYYILKSCRKCKRFDGGPYQPPTMPALPKVRVTEVPPFTHTGLDYLGPLYTKTNGQEKKVWVCIFTCMVTRAVHLELVDDLTAEQFLLSLRRFIARRGKPNVILSDNAKQFKLAKSAIDQLWSTTIHDERVTSYVGENSIKWTFIPERAPWMGGFYERLVQSVKRALRKTIQNITLNMIQLETLVIEIESMLNSRPLTYVGSDLNDGRALTPAHFLSLNPKVGMPSIELDDPLDPQYLARISTKEALLRSWSKGERHLQMFWNVWRNEYLLNLRERTQSQLKSPKSVVRQHPSIGDVVHIRTESSRGSWPLAKIVQVIPSADGEIRSAKVQLPSGTILNRAIIHLFPMELAETPEIKLSESPRTALKEHKEVKQTVNQTRPARHAAEVAKQRIKALANESVDEDDIPNTTTGGRTTSIFLNPSMILMFMFLLITMIQPGLSLHPLLCEKGNAKFTLNLTNTHTCNFQFHNNNRDKVYKARVTIYKRNIAKYESQAFKCSKIKSVVEAYTNFAKAGWDQRTRDETVPVSESDCWSMIQNRRCREGPLLGGEMAAFTENKVEPPYTTGNAWDCCRWYKKEIINCFMVKGKVYQSYHGSMESNLANVANCQYQKENCQLDDQSLLIWKMNKTAACEFILWKTTEGKLWDNRFLSNDYELAFTWNKDQLKMELCDQTQAIMSDQGLPIVIKPLSAITSNKLVRPNRQVEGSESLPSQLQAMELRFEFFYKESLNQAFYTVCRMIREIQQINLLLAHSEPTLIARKLLNDSNIMGRLHGSILEIWPCNPVESYTFQRMNESCTEWIPVRYNVQGQQKFGYMDPKTRIIYAHSAPTECDLAQETYLLDEHDVVYIYFSKSGELRPFEGRLIDHPMHSMSFSTYVEFKPVIHKPIQMYTLDELRGQISLNDIFASVENHALILKDLSQVVENPTSSQANAILETMSRYTPLGLLNQLTSKIHWIWVQFCCTYITIQILWKAARRLITKIMQGTHIPMKREVVTLSTQEITTPQTETIHKPETSTKSSILAIIEAMKKENE